ncbi:MAG: cyclase family protein [Gammaproteobacteria bacterium]|nr:cyclase family protein [Gammaproteobacteria bacterium]
MKLESLGALILLAWASTSVAADSAWYPSKWGKDDQLGAFNMNGPAQTLEAAKLIKTGKTYRLGIESNAQTPAYPPRNLHVIVLVPNQLDGKTLGSNHMTFADDIINGWVGVGTQIDGLGHAGVDQLYYNGVHGNDFIRPDGLTKYGTEGFPPIVTRGILIDLAMCMVKERLDGGLAYNQTEIEACAAKEGIEIKKGDVVLFNTGWLDLIGKDNALFMKTEPGLGVTGAEFLASKEVMAVGADTWGLEVLPSENKDELFHVHQILLAKNGVYILEYINTHELAADKAYEFMFVLGPARLTGAVQMIINPIAIR